VLELAVLFQIVHGKADRDYLLADTSGLRLYSTEVEKFQHDIL
jgi:hypothetical protein